ncbi:MAG: hypothetical protein R2698_01675 [Microthrixaceae bacterium]
MSRRRASFAIVIAASLVLATAGCDWVKAGTRCRTGAAPGRDSGWVLFCKNGRWQRTLTIQQAADVIVGSWAGRVEAVGGGDQYAKVGSSFGEVSVRVFRKNGSPAAGAPVTFSGAGLAAPLHTTSNAGGYAAVTPVANGVAGPWDLVVTADGPLKPTANIRLTNQPDVAVAVAVVSGADQAAAAGTSFAQPIRLAGIDRFGNPVPWSRVDVSVPDGEGTWFAPATSYGDDSGIGSINATAGNIARTVTVTATLQGTAASTTFPLRIVAGPPVNASITSGDWQGAVVGQPFYYQALSIAVSDAYGNPAVGLSVPFTVHPSAEGAAATLSANPSVVGANGLVSVNAVANSIVGDYTVTADVAGTVLTFHLNNIAAGP